MKRITLFFCVFNLFRGVIVGQDIKGGLDSSDIPKLDFHFLREYAFDKTTDDNRWKKEKAGLHVSFASTDKLYFRAEVPELEKENLSWEETGWRGERLNAKILVWSPDTINQVRFRLNDLISNKGRILSKKNIRVNMVRYVLSNYPYATKNATCDVGPRNNAYLLPDRLEQFDRFDVPGQTVRPVWLSVEIPQETEPGIYSGNIEVRSVNHSEILRVSIKVQQPVLPKPHDWKHRLDLWQNPWVVSEYFHVKPWSDEHKRLLEQHLKLYADAGGKYITTYAVYSPWADNSYRIEGTMIEWIKQKSGKWKFDYSIFDQYVELAMKVGIDKAITVYTPTPWGSRFYYLDESTGNIISENWPPDSEKFKTIWNFFLTDLKAHLEKKNWFDKTYLGINENAMEQTLAAIKVVKDHSKKWKITYAGDWHEELDALLDDFCFLYGKEPDMSKVKERSLRGATSTYYVCCNPPIPNNFIFSPPIEGRWLSWYTAAYGYDGFLRWAYDAWPADPLRDARHVLWPAGDCFLVYPGGNSGIRFEKLREGISDYEKINILRSKTAKSSDESIKQLMEEFEMLLKSFTTERDFNEDKLIRDIDKGKKMIEDLSEKIASSEKFVASKY